MKLQGWWLALAVALAGCGKTACEDASEILAECNDATGTTGETTTTVEDACEEGSESECTALCTIDNYDDDCANLNDGTRNGDYTNCLIACLATAK